MAISGPLLLMDEVPGLLGVVKNAVAAREGGSHSLRDAAL